METVITWTARVTWRSGISWNDETSTRCGFNAGLADAGPALKPHRTNVWCLLGDPTRHVAVLDTMDPLNLTIHISTKCSLSVYLYNTWRYAQLCYRAKCKAFKCGESMFLFSHRPPLLTLQISTHIKSGTVPAIPDLKWLDILIGGAARVGGSPPRFLCRGEPCPLSNEMNRALGHLCAHIG